jgi:hypothetical protein
MLFRSLWTSRPCRGARVLGGHARGLSPLGALVTALALTGCNLSDPVVATTLAPTGALLVATEVGAVVTPTPGVVLTDQRGRGIANALVTWEITTGSGTLSVDSSRAGRTIDSVRTNATGSASVGTWTLGPLAGEQRLTATVRGLDPVTFTATAAPGAPFALVARSAEVQTARVSTLVPEPPAVTVFDQFGNRVPNAPVTFAVVPGSGTLLGNTQPLSNAAGEVSIDGWRLGTSTAVPQRVQVSAPTVATPLLFRATARPDVPVRLEIASPPAQNGVPGLGVGEPPAIRARDQFGNPTGGATVTFTPRAGSGTVTGSIRETRESDGLARVGSWVLGDAPQQELLARSPQFPADSFLFRANAVSTLFDIETVFLNGPPSPRNQLAVERAVRRWTNVIAGQLPPVPVFAAAAECGPGTPAINEVITNVRIFVNLDSIDGPGAILGRAGPCFIRTVSGLPVVGFVELDTADLRTLENNGTLDDVMAHEFGHVLGLQAFNWERRSLLVGRDGSDPHFQGAVAREQFQRIGGATYPGIPVPVENTGGAGTRDSHWRLSVLRRELMVGFAQVGGMPLSALSVGALADLGYLVRLDQAEAFTVPPFGTAAFGELIMPGSTARMAYGDDTWPGAVWELDERGRRRLVRAGDWRVTRRRTGR